MVRSVSGRLGSTTCRAGSLSSWATTSRNPLVLWMEGAACPRQEIAVPAINSRVKTDRIRTSKSLEKPEKLKKPGTRPGIFSIVNLLPIEGWCLVMLGDDLLGILRQRFCLGQQLEAFDDLRIGLGAHL